MKTQTNLALGEVLELFMNEVTIPNRETLERYVAQFPHFAEELAEFSAHWLLLEAVPAAVEAPVGAKEQEQAASAMSRLRDHLRQLEMQNEVVGQQTQANPFAQRSAASLKSLAAQLNLDVTLMAKLKNRLILVETVPASLVQALARELGVLSENLVSWLQAPPRLAASRFKAETKPRTMAKERFLEAVERSTLDASQKRLWYDA